MNIIFGTDYIDQHIVDLKKRYLLLPLDKIKFTAGDEYKQAWAVINMEEVTIDDTSKLDNISLLHEQLMHQYCNKDWDFCLTAIDQLKGNFKGSIDSFYDILTDRIHKYKQQDPGNDWKGIYEKYSDDTISQH
jgi:hypothetical protein